MRFTKIMRRTWLFFILIILTMAEAVAMCSRPDAAAPDIRLVREVKGVREYVLASNGLRILLYEDHSAPVATAMVTYLAGARDEDKGHTGVAHLLEHMMFKGTPKYHRARGTQPARLLEQVGAELNAMTHMDTTTYYEMVPNSALRLALDIESDRMRHLLLDGEEFIREKRVVQNEMERYYDSPVVKLHNKIRAAAFTRHPYRNPVIGYREDVEAMRVEDLRDFYQKHYRPGNAVLTVIGDFRTDQVLGWIRETFGQYRGEVSAPGRAAVLEPAQKEPRRVLVDEGAGPKAVMISHKIPPSLHQDTVALYVLGKVLSGGQTSRLYQALVETGLAVSVSSGSEAMAEGGLFTTYATLASGAEPSKVEEEILRVYDAIVRHGISNEELQKAKNQLIAETAYARDGSFAMASELNEAIAWGDWTCFLSYPDRIRHVTRQQVMEAAERYLRRSGMTVGFFVPAEEKPDVPVAGDVRDTRGHHETHSADEDFKAVSVQIDATPAAETFSERVRVERIGNARVLLLPTQVRDVVTLVGSFYGGGTAQARNPVLAALTAALLDKGTLGRKPFEIAGILESRGASVSYNASKTRVHFQARCLRQDLELVVKLAAEQLRRPSFDLDEFEKAKQRKKVRLEEEMTLTLSRAWNRLFNALYPDGHVHHQVLLERQLEALGKTTLEDVKAFYRERYGSQELNIAVVGDFEADKILPVLKEAWADWQPAEWQEDTLKKAPGLLPANRINIHVDGKTKMDVFFAHPLPLDRHHPDYLAAFIANDIFGGNSTARLPRRIRDQRGLTYGIRSYVYGVDRDVDGVWLIYLMINPAMVEEGIRQTSREIRIFAEKGVNEDELSEKKTSILGKFLVGLATTGGLADAILQVEELDLGIGYLDQYPGLIRALTLQETNRVIRQYFRPESLQLVVAGEAVEDSRTEQGF